MKLFFCLIITSLLCSLHAQESDCPSLNINLQGSEFQQRENTAGPPGLPGKHGPAGSAGPKGSKGEVGRVPLEAERKIIENNRVLLNISQQFVEVFRASEVKMNKMQRDLDELKAENVKLKQKSVEIERRFYRTCSEMRVFNPDVVSGMYTLNPSGHNYVTVFCNVTGNTAITTIRHDTPDEVNIKGFDPHLSYGKLVEYELPSSYIREIIDSHLYCRQFIKYRCKGSILLKSDDQYGYWASQDGTRRNYWGGATKSHHCACGMTGTCLDKKQKCNCDQNSSDVITSDEGYLENKSNLPVGYLRFGDTGGSDENAWYELGPLECF